MSKRLDLTGQRFGRFVAIRATKPRRGASMWICRCDCGAIKAIRLGNLRSGQIKSCGCLFRDAHLKHGLARTPEYKAWKRMHWRCDPDNETHNVNYFFRGIVVCKEWSGIAGLKKFIAHVGKRPSRKYSLDRIDNNSGYAPGNVRWATPLEQSRNRRQFGTLDKFSTEELLAEIQRRKRAT